MDAGALYFIAGTLLHNETIWREEALPSNEESESQKRKEVQIMNSKCSDMS